MKNMVEVTFNCLKGEKSAIIMHKSSPLEIGAGSPLYVSRVALAEFAGKEALTNEDKGLKIKIPAGFRGKDMVRNGEIVTTKDGVILQEITYDTAPVAEPAF